MNGIFDVTEKPLFDNSIVDLQFHTHQSNTSTFNYNDEMRIAVEGDRLTLPSLSHIYIEGRVVKEDGTPSKTVKFINNGLAHLFSEIRYEINGIPIDTTTKVGITSFIKGLLSFTPSQMNRLQNAGWYAPDQSKPLPRNEDGSFNACIPLSTLLGFAEDYKKAILNIRQELVLIRSNTDNNCLFNTDDGIKDDKSNKIFIDKLYWRIPHVVGNLKKELAVAKYMDRNVDTPVKFRSWELHTLTGLPQTKNHSWNIKSVRKSQSPSYVILAFQRNREDKLDKYNHNFDHCNINNIRVYLNSIKYPYDNLNLDFTKYQISTLYEMYADFQHSYYDIEPEPYLSLEKFKEDCPIMVIDTSKQPENIAYQTQSINVRVEFDTNSNIAENTIVYCLLLYEREFAYNALTKYVKQL